MDPAATTTRSPARTASGRRESRPLAKRTSGLLGLWAQSAPGDRSVQRRGTRRRIGQTTTTRTSEHPIGNVGQVIAGDDGNAVETVEYDPYGVRLEASTGDGAFGFSTIYRDPETGQLAYNFRKYQPGVGRWLNRDPKTEPGHRITKATTRTPSTSRRIARGPGADEWEFLRARASRTPSDSESIHLFVGNDPVNGIDLLGEAKIEVRYNALGEIGGLTWYHAYVLLHWPNGERTFYRGGPSAGGPGNPTQSLTSPGGSFGPIILMIGAYRPGTIDWETGSPPSVTVVDDNVAARCYHNQLVTYAHRIVDQRITYHPLGPNSNSVAHELVANLGFARPSPPDAGMIVPGHDDALFDYNAPTFLDRLLDP